MDTPAFRPFRTGPESTARPAHGVVLMSAIRSTLPLSGALSVTMCSMPPEMPLLTTSAWSAGTFAYVLMASAKSLAARSAMTTAALWFL